MRIGITGHRLDKLSGTDVTAVGLQLRDVFRRIDAAVPACCLVSALAEGADRLAIDAAPADWPLIVVLPMPRDLYRTDFLPAGQTTSASSEAFDLYLAKATEVVELPAPCPERAAEQAWRDERYAALGHALVNGLECLVAVWDGRPPKGPGGTAAVVAEALERGLAVIWIDAAGRVPARLLTDLHGGDPDTRPLDEAALRAALASVVGRSD